MNEQVQAISAEDIFLWPDGTHCYRDSYEGGYMNHMSDDYEVIPQGTPRWEQIEDES